jgi:hypothetical protein
MTGQRPSVLTVDSFLSHVDDTLRISDDPPYTFILGGGFSYGVIPTARDIVRQLPGWLHKELRCSDSVSDFVKHFWEQLNHRLTDHKVTLDGRGLPSLNKGDLVSEAYGAAMLHVSWLAVQVESEGLIL